MRNLHTQRNVHGKPMRLGKNQIYALTALFDEGGMLRKGTAKSAWLSRIMLSFRKHGLVGVFDQLTVQGLAERERLRPLRRQNVPLPADLIVNNKTLRQSAHIEASVADKQKREMGEDAMQMAQARFRTSLSAEYMTAQEVEDEAAEYAHRAAATIEPLRRKVTMERWLRALWVATFFAAKVEKLGGEL